MRTSKSFSILFWVYASRTKNNLTTLFVRVTLNGKRANISLKYKIPIDFWDAKAQKLMGKSKAALSTESVFEGNFAIHSSLFFPIILALGLAPPREEPGAIRTAIH